VIIVGSLFFGISIVIYEKSCTKKIRIVDVEMSRTLRTGPNKIKKTAAQIHLID